MTKIRFHVAYDGTDFCGWQRQNHGPLKSVQHVIEDALQHVLQEKITLFASGRTDAGVHALNQVCHFVTQKEKSRFQNWDFAWAIQSQLPACVVIKQVWIAPDDFHATISSTHKTYRYWIYNYERGSPFLLRYADWIRKPVDLEVLQSCTEFIKGIHDFKSFQSVGTPVHHTVREIYNAKWRRRKDRLIEFEVTGSGFLKQMVRNLVGTMLMIEKKGLEPRKMKEILDLQSRRAAGPPAPACGLHLYRVYYPQELDNACEAL